MARSLSPVGFQRPALSDGKSRDCLRPKPKRSTYRLSRSGPRTQPHQNRPDVAGLDDDVREGERSVGGEVRDAVPPDPDVAGADVEHFVAFDGVFLERRRRGDDLEGRPGLVDVLDGPVAPLRRRRRGKCVGVERGLAGERQDFAAARVEHHDRPGVRIVGPDPGPELALDDVLQVLVDGQLDGRAGRRRPVDAAERPVTRIRVYQGLPGVARDLGIVGRFDPAQSLVVDADVTDDMRGQLAVGVVAAILGEESDAVQSQGGYTARLRGRHLAPHVDEGRPAAESPLQIVPAGGAAIVQCVADRSRRRRQVLVPDLRRQGMDSAAVGVDSHAVQLQRRHAARLPGRRVALEHRVASAAPQTALERVPVRRRAVVQRPAQIPRSRRRVIDLRRDGVDGIGVDAVGEHASVPIENLAALRMDLHRPPLLTAGPLDQLGMLQNLQMHQLRLDGDDPDRRTRRRRPGRGAA